MSWNLHPSLNKVKIWLQGPKPPRPYRIRPFFEALQTAPTRYFEALVPRAARFWVGIFMFAVWVTAFVTIISHLNLPKDIGGYGAPVRLSCIARFWSDSRSCGLDGQNCLPFNDHRLAFSCPSDCGRVKVLNPYTIGAEQIIYQSLVVGGTPNVSNANEMVYRGDSFICAAAIHAGAIDDKRGGCGALSVVGEKRDYGSIERNGIPSVGFDSNFPLSFTFDHGNGVASDSSKCRDPRWNLLAISTIFATLFSIFTTTPSAFFIPVSIITYFQISLASDPPSFQDYSTAVSTSIGRLLPAAFVALLMFHFCIRKTLAGLNAPFEKAILWTGGLWVGALSNLTFDKIPIQRLTPHDLNQQPGAITALVFIVLILLFIALCQAWAFRMEGRLLRYLGLYCILGISLVILVVIPGLELRIHHYILALLLLPGTAIQTRPSLLYQGLLVGLFINGIARWGFDSILQTEAQLRGDALLGDVIPTIHTHNITSSNITFSWDVPSGGYEGVSVLVNDVERFRGFEKDKYSEFTWTREGLDAPEYFRFGFVKYYILGGVVYSDFTRAGVWERNGSWTDIPPGRS
ncbi:LCCL domain-containing protein [Delitschia confertaspora ATCC 74209]|uniref:LCCL domain-containing protein n=1 Tax=Delitschia confertaspora ATCC 74209 TaxID=1513339 RepID=A0A9P4JX41_9PLEO|nr:LCCL domain-containing protein [Delitschia confertaspora ATCC 74209]